VSPWKSSDATNCPGGFQALPKRWIVERAFGWLLKFCRLRSDYERLTCHSRAMIQLAMIRIVLRRIH
jgi:putative transposase